MTAPIDIRARDLTIVQEILRNILAPEAKVWVFGSRAKWTAKTSSDLDLAIDAGRPLTLAESSNLADAFEESDLPYKVDVVDMYTMSDTFRPYVEKERVALDWENKI
ncbi:MAG: nucleotidyltransferase domain-containing protein [Alphaproteobacteria bacterium]|nr:nucleotidyltransferase domain-containing protein [Alphaproteobacteria bacterium]